MKLYQFDGVDDALLLLPMAARRALDLAGRKLSLAAWQAAPLGLRQALVEEGSRGEPDATAALSVIQRIDASAAEVVPLTDPPPTEAPAAVVEIYGSARPLGANLWRRLSPLDRYALVKVTRSRHPQRLQAAYDELVGPLHRDGSQ